jgi:hypothetical protein
MLQLVCAGFRPRGAQNLRVGVVWPVPGAMNARVMGLRGRTRPGRLRLLNPLLEREAARTTLDIGLGDRPDTTIELFELLGPRVMGIDADAARVERAQSFAQPGLAFQDHRRARAADPRDERAARLHRR